MEHPPPPYPFPFPTHTHPYTHGDQNDSPFSKELAALACLDTALQHRLAVIRIERASTARHARHRAVESVEAVAADAGPDPQRGDAEGAGAKSPEEAAKGSSYKGAWGVLVECSNRGC